MGSLCSSAGYQKPKIRTENNNWQGIPAEQQANWNGATKLRAILANHLLTPFSFQHFICVTDTPFLSPKRQNSKKLAVKRKKKKPTWKWAIANSKLGDIPKHWGFLENKPLQRSQWKVAIAGKFQIKVLALPLVHCVGKILRHVQYVIFESHVQCPLCLD